MKSSAKKVELASVDDLFSTEESRADAQREKVVEIPLSELHPFKGHPCSFSLSCNFSVGCRSYCFAGLLGNPRHNFHAKC